MYQSFSTPSSPETGAPRLASLRKALSEANLDGFLIPRADAHMGENVAPRDERLAWLTGFTGSDGHCAVLANIAGVFVDGRYTIQVQKQINTSVFTPQVIPGDRLSVWLIKHLPNGGIVGYDAMLHSYGAITELAEHLAPHNIKLRQCPNLVDQVWDDQPSAPLGKITPHPIEFAGIESDSKRHTVAQKLREAQLSATVLTLPDSICWLLNIRGSDISNTPVALVFAVVHVDGSVDLIVDEAKISPELLAHMGADIRLISPNNFEETLKGLEGKVGVDKSSAPIWIAEQLQSSEWFPDPCILPKACKNQVELAGSRQAHIRDAVAMCEFLAWVDQGIDGLTEIDVVTKLEGFRRNTNALTDISFDTICGSGLNGAIVHYRVDEHSNRKIEQDTLLLVDSGGQYLDGTTDITRTIAIGEPTADMIRCFTLVLKGMLALSALRWPQGISGHDIDAMARAPLWAAGFDYKHGTGHGVGAYLSVHEGPARISSASDIPLETGMILSNEPGYYRKDEWGIRIENLIVVGEPTSIEGGEGQMHSFETITWVPIDTRLIDRNLLSSPECEWLNNYHIQVLHRVGPLVSQSTRIWLEAACRPIS